MPGWLIVMDCVCHTWVIKIENMPQPNPAQFFDAARASVYDAQADNMAPVRDTLHYCLRLVVSSLPEDARIVCVGAGTGSEMSMLAKLHPAWKFVAVEPAPAMLERCRQRAESEGFAERCEFHEGTLDTLPKGDLFDLATSLLVSHFIVDIDERQSFYSEIAKRLRSGGLLVTCDLATELGTHNFEQLYLAWEALFTLAGLTMGRQAFGTAIGMLSPQAVERLIASSGFDAPVPFYQAVFMPGWFARRSSLTVG